MKVKGLRKHRRVRRNWRAFWILLVSLSVFLYFLAVGIYELFLLVLIAAWTKWCVRR